MRFFRNPALLLPVFLLLAACGTESKIGKSNQGMLLWAVETVPTDRTDQVFSSAIKPPYWLVPGFLPLEKGTFPAEGGSVEVDPVSVYGAEETLVRNGNTEVRWYAVPVFDTDIVAPAYFVEGGFFERSHFAVSQRMPIARELNSNSNPRVYQITDIVPLIKIGQGEAVYVGTFTATLTPGKNSFVGTRRVRSVRRSYRIDHQDANGIIAELGLNPNRLRIIDVFRGNNGALRRYQGAGTVQ